MNYFQEKGVYNERPGPNHFGSVSLSAPAGSTSFNSKSVLPAIAPSEKTPSDTNLHYQHLATVSQPRTDSCEVDEILLKHSLGASLEATKEDTLHRLKNYLETKDTKHTNAHHPDDIYQEFGRFKVALSKMFPNDINSC